MKEGWEYKKLKDVATFTRGLTYSKNDEAENSNNIVLRSNNVDLSTGKLNFEELKYLKPEFSIPEEKKVKKGSLLMCMSNGSKIHLGKVALIDKDYPYAFGGFMALVTPNEKLNPRFFHYSLSSPEYKDFIKKLSAGANINNIKVKELDLFTIPVPPLSEQQSIVDYLDSAFAKIDAMKANAEKSLNEAKALFQASLKEMLEPKEGWEEKKLGEIICHLRTGLNPRTHFKLNTPDAEGYYITVRELKGFTIEPDEKTDKVNSAAIKRINERSNLKIGDVLFSGTGTIGKTALVSELPRNWNIKEGVYAMTPKHSVLDSRWFIYYIGSEFFLRLVNDKAAGAGVRSIPMKALIKLPVFIPSLSEQQSIVETLDSLKSKVDRLQENYDKISLECDGLKQAILRQVFE